MRVEVREVIHAADEPELRDAIFADRLNVVECDACHWRFRIDTPVFYLDPGRRFAVWWVPDGANRKEEVAEQFRAMESSCAAAAPDFRMHLAYERRELVERILVCEAGLDPRLIEYVKYMIHSRNPSRADPAACRLYYAGEAGGPGHLRFVVVDTATGRLTGALDYPREGFEAAAGLFQGRPSAPLTELFPGPHLDARQLLQDA